MTRIRIHLGSIAMSFCVAACSDPSNPPSGPAGTATGGQTSVAVPTAGTATTGGTSNVSAGTGGSFPATGGNVSAGASTGGTGGTDGGGKAGTGGSPATCPSSGWQGGKQTINTTWDGEAREYVVYIPASYTGSTPVPLMLVIHGAHNTPAMAESWSQMNTVADQGGFIIAYPAGLDCWNSGRILGGCMAADDDVGFLKNVVAEVESHACIDTKRVYATGISNGAMMAQHLGCEAADIFAAVGGVAGPTGSCSPSRPVSVFYVHGTEDSTVGYSSAQPNVTGWADRNGCSSTPTEVYSQGSTTCVGYQGCTAGAEVEFCTVTGMGHCWPEDENCGPGGGPSYGVTDFKASPMMWEFFSRHPLP